MQKLLVCGDTKISQVFNVCEQLEHIGVDFKVLNPNDSPAFSFSPSNNKIRFSEKEEFEPFALWTARTNFIAQFGSTSEWAEKKAFHMEWDGILLNLYTHFNDVAYSPLHSLTLESRKIEQLKVAAGLGFFVPLSVATNDGSTVRDVFEKDQLVIVKAIGVANLPIWRAPGFIDGFSPSVQTYKAYELASILDENKPPPMLIQEYITRSNDYRVAVVGKDIHCMKISKPVDLIDSRKLGEKQVFEFVDIPLDTKEKLLLFLKKFNLPFGHFDFVEMNDGGMMFLECNPDGMWVFYDTDRRISRSYANFFKVKM